MQDGMSAALRNYQSAEGLTDEQMAELLTDKLGRAVSVTGYKVVRGRKNKDAPAEWLESLGITPLEPPTEPPPTDDGPAPGDDEPPDMNTGRERDTRTAPIASPLPFEPATAQMQLTLLYTMAGKGAAIALRSPPVADVWAQHAPQIAAAYIEWARYNPTVAHYIAAITLGGPAGQLVLLHGSLIVTTLIVSGRVNPEQFIPQPPPMGDATDTINEPDQGAPDGDDTGTARAPRAKRRRSGNSAVRGVE
jgi:hypothetical protein